MTSYYFYTTSKNDRWDTVATKFYGNCFEIEELISANEHVGIKPIFDEGTLLRVPVKESITLNANNKLPIWKRSQIGEEE